MTVKGGNKCHNWPDFPISVIGATGGLIGDTVIICGGWDDYFGYDFEYVDECYSMTSEKATLVTRMSVGRYFAASIVLNDNTLWVTGGSGGGASTDYVKMTGTMPGPDLPMALEYHAMVAINNTCSMVIGGYTNGYVTSASTFYYDHNEGEWTTGPSLMQARGEGHAAGIVTDEVTDENFVAVTGGWRSGPLDSTEILQDGYWIQGNINDATMYMLSFWKT